MRLSGWLWWACWAVCTVPVSLFCSVFALVYKHIANNPLWIVDFKLDKCSEVRNQGGQQLQCSQIGELAWAGFLVLYVFLLEYIF